MPTMDIFFLSKWLFSIIKPTLMIVINDMNINVSIYERIINHEYESYME